jgi:murein DD-endopeptidase MepM/ murein hydrolase activator NlpD
LLKTILSLVGMIQFIGTLIAISHANAVYSRYDHLISLSSKVKVGQAVSEGQERVGTGYTFMPHLHFQAFIFTGSNGWIDFDTVSVQGFIL